MYIKSSATSQIKIVNQLLNLESCLSLNSQDGRIFRSTNDKIRINSIK